MKEQTMNEQDNLHQAIRRLAQLLSRYYDTDTQGYWRVLTEDDRAELERIRAEAEAILRETNGHGPS